MALSGRHYTKADKAWISAIVDLGCICCLLEMGIYTPCGPHHIDGKTKPGAHRKTLGLCFEHHQGGRNDAECVSRHPYKAEFERRYGTEGQLLAATDILVAGGDIEEALQLVA